MQKDDVTSQLDKNGHNKMQNGYKQMENTMIIKNLKE